jgi:hypothetical protein
MIAASAAICDSPYRTVFTLPFAPLPELLPELPPELLVPESPPDGAAPPELFWELPLGEVGNPPLPPSLV